MRNIKQVENTNGNYFKLYLGENIIKEVKITRIKREKDGRIYFLLLYSNGRVIDEVYKYINFYCSDYTINRKEQIISSLKLLYSFIELYDRKLENLNERDIKNLSDFILGIGIEKENQDTSVGRGITTHNLYFDNIREFFKFLGINNKNIFEQKNVINVRSGYGMLAHTKKVEIKKYKTNLSEAKIKETFVPKYISFEEYKKIINFIECSDNKNSLRNRIIIELMYLTGMRLGEVLGLTLEDIKDNIDNPDYGVLYIRNRVTDKKYQNAKGCMKVRSKKDYNTKQYQKKDYGYQIVNIAPNLYGLLKEYIDESRSVLNVSEKVYDNISIHAIADSVYNSEVNEYVFLNKNGYPLSSSGWNKFIKDIFNCVGIVIDKNNKKNNLSHRFRHGYAMYLIKVENKSIEYVKEMMRHASLQSTLIYYNPTEDEKLEDIKRIEEKLRNDINLGM